MASSFAGLSLFNSGPHRFAVRAVGRLVRGPFQTPLDLPYSVDEGRIELRIIQTGRLIAATDAALWALFDAVRTRAEQPLTGTLIDHHARQWPGMTLVSFRPEGPTDRARTVSLAYRAEYLRFGP